MSNPSSSAPAILVLDPLDVRALLQGDTRIRFHEALKVRASEGWTYVLAHAPFLTEEVSTIAKAIVQAPDHARRLALRPLVEGWLRREVKHVFEAIRQPVPPSTNPRLVTLSLSLWERFLLDLVREFIRALGRTLKIDVYLNHPARIRFPEGELAWESSAHPGPFRGIPFVHLVAADLLCHAYANPDAAPIHQTSFTLLPPGDLSVIRLAVTAIPGAVCLRLNQGDELPPRLEALLPPGMTTEGLNLFSATSSSERPASV